LSYMHARLAHHVVSVPLLACSFVWCVCVWGGGWRLWCQIGEDDIEIDIDRVDPATFWVVDKFVKECMGSGGDKKRRATGEAGATAGAGGGGAAGAGAPSGAPSHKKIRQ
jgi:hypothetical protein